MSERPKPTRTQLRIRRLGSLALLVAFAAAGIAIAKGGPATRHRGTTTPVSRAVSRARQRTIAARRQKAALQKIVDLAPGSDPSVLPGPVLIADRTNNRIIEVSPTGHILWQFPRPGDLATGQTFLIPDDAFFSPNGKDIIATEEDDFVVSVIDVKTHRIIYRYGHPGVAGSAPNFLDNPDDALLSHGGQIILADIKNCRLLTLQMPSHHIVRQLGETGVCEHQPGVSFGSPNGDFPMLNGDRVITEINGDWVDVMTPGGHILSSTNAPGFSYPSDTNEVRPGVLLSADYTKPGAIEEFTPSGRLLWRYAPTGPKALNEPSLALPLPNGDVLANDDYNDRVIVIDPRTNRIVWQYGHTGVPGRRPGYLHKPDGVDLAPPYNLMNRFR